MALRWVEGFETFGNLNDTPSVWGDYFYGKYIAGFCDGNSSKLVEGYRGIGLALLLDDFNYNYFSAGVENSQVLTAGCAYKTGIDVYYYGEVILSFKDYINTQIDLIILRDMGSGTHELLLRRGSTTLDTLGFINPDEWVYLEVQVTISNTGSYECRKNGAVVCSGSNVDTQDSANAYATQVNFGPNKGSYDDAYVLDDDPGLDDFLGPIKVRRALPTADVSAQWTRSTGVNNYANVDEVPPSLTDYNYSKTSAHLDLFDFQDSAGDILGAQLNVGAKLSEPGGKGLTLVCDSNATQQTDDIQLGDSELPLVHTLTLDTDPDTLALWTQAGFNAAQWGVKVV